MNNKEFILFKKIITLIPLHGCCDKTIETAVKKTGFKPEYAHLLYKNGIKTFTEQYNDYINEEFTAAFLKNSINITSTREKIKSAVITRFSFIKDDKLLSRKINSFLLKPENLPLKIKILAKISDKIWIAAEDKSLDLNYYTKRLTLGMVYESVFSYWLYNENCSNDDLSKFLDKRLENVISLGKIKQKLKTGAEKILSF